MGYQSLVMDGLTAEFMMGWNWCRLSPDRLMGLFSGVWDLLEEEAKVVVSAVMSEEAVTKEEG